MAHRLLGRGLKNVQSTITEIRQEFNYLLLLDFESTCEKNATLQPQEIIEFPCLAMSTKDWKIHDIFHEYVKPKINPTLTPFCTDLTGIMQEHVDAQPHFPEIFANFHEWLVAGGFLTDEKTSAFVTCGDWDLKVMLPAQCALERLEIPKYFDRWIDLKKTYCETKDYYPKSLKDMLIRSNIPLQGRLHSGINDTQNMMNIIIELARHNAVFKITSTRKKINDPAV